MTRNIALLLNIFDYNGLLIINVSAKRPYYDCDTVWVLTCYICKLSQIKILFLYLRLIHVFSTPNKKEGANISIKLYIKEIYNFEHVFINE